MFTVPRPTQPTVAEKCQPCNPSPCGKFTAFTFNCFDSAFLSRMIFNCDIVIFQVLTVFVEKWIVDQLAHARLITWVYHQAVGLNVSSTLIVIRLWLVSTKNVATLVRAFAAKMLSAESSITTRFAAALVE